MGAQGDGRFDGELKNGVRLGLLEQDSESESESRSGSGSGPGSTRDIEEAVKVLLQGLGEGQDREGIRKTPLRVAKAIREGTRGYRQKVKDIIHGALFPEAGLEDGIGYAGGSGGLVIVRDIDLFSYCESCLLPFRVQCHIGYVPSGQRVVGLSKLSRVADVYAKRLQDPQRLADEVCSALHNGIRPAGVAVALQCWHIQFPEALRSNSITKHPSKFDMEGWVQASVCSSSGVFDAAKSSLWDDFLALSKFRGMNLEGGNTRRCSIQSWCPSRSLEVPHCNGHSTRNPSNGRIRSKSGATQSAMIAAVSSILRSLGEDPTRKELVGTPYRYVQWLMNFKTSDRETKLNGSNLSTAGSGLGHGQIEIHSELNLAFCSQCEHHLLPFHGVVHVGCLNKGGGAIERSDLQALVHFYGCKLQVQEKLTRQIAEAVHSVVGGGVMVVVEANHVCMISRGIEKLGSSTATIAVMGQFSTDPEAKEMFLQTISASTASGG